MAIDPADATSPKPTDNTQVAGEFRALKAYHNNTRERVEDLEAIAADLPAFTALGKALAQSASTDSAQSTLGAGSAGKNIFTQETIADVLGFLGLSGVFVGYSNPAVGRHILTFGTEPGSGLGSIKVQIQNENVLSTGTTFPFPQSYTMAVFGVVGCLTANGDYGIWIPQDQITLGGFRADHNNSSPKTACFISIGI